MLTEGTAAEVVMLTLLELAVEALMQDSFEVIIQLIISLFASVEEL